MAPMTGEPGSLEGVIRSSAKQREKIRMPGVSLARSSRQRDSSARDRRTLFMCHPGAGRGGAPPVSPPN